jgi:hypothetical protein
VTQRRSWLDGWPRSELSALEGGTGVSETVSVTVVLDSVREWLARASETAAADGRWAVACNYLSLRGRLWAELERLAIWPEHSLEAGPLWRTAGDCERLADTAQREDWAELDALTEAESRLIDLALYCEREGEGL